MKSVVFGERVSTHRDELDREIAELKERLRELREKKRAAAKQKKLRREEIVALLLRECPHGMDVAQLARKVEERYVSQGRKAAPKESDRAAKRLVQLGVLLGVLEEENGKVAWKKQLLGTGP